MAFTPDRGAPKDIREMYHWVWNQLSAFSDFIEGGGAPVNPNDPLLPLLVEAGYGGVNFDNGPQAFPDIDATWQTLPTDTASVAAPIDVIQDVPSSSLALENEGAWTLSYSLSISHDASVVGSRITGLRLFDVTDGAPLQVLPLTIGRNAESTSISANRLIDVSAPILGHQLVIQIGGGATIGTIELLSYSFGFVHSGAYVPPP
jgi:hypothetical protein